MPLKYALCPDGITIEVEQCLKQCRRAGGRCLTLPTLHTVLRDRPWTGIPSTTQLLNGTRMEYLKIVSEYAVDPMENVIL